VSEVSRGRLVLPGAAALEADSYACTPDGIVDLRTSLLRAPDHAAVPGGEAGGYVLDVGAVCVGAW
jgi:hypothetical protein